MVVITLRKKRTNKHSGTSPKQRVVVLFAIAGIVIAILSIYFAYSYISGNKFFGLSVNQPSDQTISYDQPTKDQIENGNDIKQESVKNDPTTSKPNANQESSPESSSVQPDGKRSVTVAITSANQNGSTIQIRSLISAVVNTGTCTLRLTRTGHQNVIMSASIQALSTSSTCAGFDVNSSELSSGTWTATIHFENINYIGDASTEIVIQ